MNAERKEYLESLCKGLRRDLIEILHEKQTGHPGGSLSVCEILTAIYIEEAQLRPEDPTWEGRDRIILSKGHAAPMQYLVMAEKGFFPKEEMHTLRDLNTRLQGHPSYGALPGIELSGGPLGLGLSAAVGKALALRLKKSDSDVYAIIGDGEMEEGIIWESAMCASKFHLDHLIAILDWNGVQLDGTNEEIMPLGDVKAKWESFGWKCICVDGHDIEAVTEAIEQAKAVQGQPVIILAKTVKGKGVSFMEGKNTWHGSPIPDDKYAIAMQELGE